MRATSVEAPFTVQIERSGPLPRGIAEYTERKLRKLHRFAPEPILKARVRVTHLNDPAVPRPVVAEGTLDVNGRPVRAHVAAPHAHEAVDLLQARLRGKLQAVARHWQARRGRLPEATPHEWRHESEPAHRPDYYPRPVEEREVLRRKSFTVPRTSPDEALFDMEMADQDFYLFTDVTTDADSLVYRSDGGLRLARVSPQPEPPAEPLAVRLAVDEHPAPSLELEAAVQRLDATGARFVFFADAETGRGSVLYLRYDGHYGLITPAA